MRLAAALVVAVAAAPEPWLPLHGGAFTGPPVPLSPDPLVRYVWDASADVTQLQVFNVTGIAAELLPPTPTASFEGWDSLASPAPHVRVSGPGAVAVDFGVELPGWLELDSPDLAAADLPLLQLATGEYRAVDVVGATPKQRVPVAYPGGTYRLETNAALYEGVRYGFIVMASPPSRPFTITGFRAVVQTKPANYTGSFDAPGDGESRLTAT